MKVKVPKESSEIDEKWLTTVMKATLKDQDVEVLNVSEIDGPNHGFVNGVKKALIKVDQEKIKLWKLSKDT